MGAALRVLLVDDDEMFRKSMGRELAHMGFSVGTEGRGQAGLARLRQEPFDVVVLDVRMPDGDGVSVLQEIKKQELGVAVVMLTGHGTVSNAVEAMKLGAVDYLTKPCSLDEVEVTIRKAAEHVLLRSENLALRAELARRHAAELIIGQSRAIRSVLDLIGKVAPSDSTILITGESGVGKELVARAIHGASRRKEAPFVVIDCASLQESLLESELFGHERGAYTGATNLKHGLFEVADTGTVFLDELGEISTSIQARLLRVLETGTFRRVGGTSDVRVDVRLLAATNRPLEEMMVEGSFRKDLFYRLHVVTVEMPPLRDRKEDIPLLARGFLAESRPGEAVDLSAEALDLLMRHDWPGNVRELKHAIERAVLLCRGNRILTTDLPENLGQPRATPAPEPDGGSLRSAQRDHIARVLAQVDGRRGEAARILGISERQLYRKLRLHRLGRDEAEPDSSDTGGSPG